jgi:cytosine/adenosine deaminase-related metal-dependent hydrolase
MDLLGLLRLGARVGLGSDGMASSLWPEIQTAAILHKHERRDPRVVWQEIFDMLQNNSSLASIFFPKPLGKLTPGSFADVVIYDYTPPTPLTSENFLAHFLFGFSHVRAHTVLIHGKLVMENNIFTQVDEAQIAAKSRAQAASFWEKIISEKK